MAREGSSGDAYMDYHGVPYSEWAKLISEWIFSERDRAILTRRLLDGLTFKELAKEFQMSEDRLKQIVRKGKDELIKHI